MLCVLILMTENYACLTTAEIKTIKDLYQDFLHDVKPEVVTLAKVYIYLYICVFVYVFMLYICVFVYIYIYI
jgi:hypothetical protein